jgi:hypothetical protein
VTKKLKGSVGMPPLLLESPPESAALVLASPPLLPSVLDTLVETVVLAVASVAVVEPEPLAEPLLPELVSPAPGSGSPHAVRAASITGAEQRRRSRRAKRMVERQR